MSMNADVCNRSALCSGSSKSKAGHRLQSVLGACGKSVAVSASKGTSLGDCFRVRRNWYRVLGGVAAVCLFFTQARLRDFLWLRRHWQAVVRFLLGSTHNSASSHFGWQVDGLKVPV